MKDLLCQQCSSPLPATERWPWARSTSWLRGYSQPELACRLVWTSCPSLLSHSDTKMQWAGCSDLYLPCAQQDLSQLNHQPISIKSCANPVPPTAWQCTSHKPGNHVCVSLHLYATLIPLVCLLSLQQIPHCSNFYCFILCSDTWECKPSVLFFKTVFIIRGSLYFHIDFMISLTIYTRVIYKHIFKTG